MRGPGAAIIYKILPHAAWQAALSQGCYEGSADDARDGFIHFSAAEQVAGTAAKHFRGQADLVLVAIDADKLGAALRWEPSRGGALFPHLYGPLDVAAAINLTPLPLDDDGIPHVPGDLCA